MQITRRLAISSAVSAFAYAKLAPMVSHAQENKTEPLKAPAEIVKLATTLKGKPVLEVAEELHKTMKINGKMGIKGKKRAYEMPLGAEEVYKYKYGDCSDLAYWVVSGFIAAELNKHEDCKPGAILVHIKGDPKNVWHIVPFLLVKGAPKNLASKRFQTDEKFAAATMRELGTEGNPNDWGMVLVDPQAEQMGRIGIETDAAEPISLVGVEALYYTEAGMHYAYAKNHAAAENMFRKAINIYDDAVAHLNLTAIEGKKGNVDKALAHAKKAHGKMPLDNSMKENYVKALVITGSWESDAASKGIGTSHGEKAIELLEEAQRISPKDKRTLPELARAYFNLGVCLLNDGNRDKGNAYFEKAAELGLAEAKEMLKNKK